MCACQTSSPTQPRSSASSTGVRPKVLLAVGCLVARLGKVGVRVDMHAAGKGEALAHEVGRDGEGRAGGEDDAQHAVAGGVVVLPRSGGASRAGSPPHPRQRYPAAGRPWTRRRTSSRARRGSGSLARAPPRSGRRAGRRWARGRCGRWRSCSRRASARRWRRAC